MRKRRGNKETNGLMQLGEIKPLKLFYFWYQIMKPCNRITLLERPWASPTLAWLHLQKCIYICLPAAWAHLIFNITKIDLEVELMHLESRWVKPEVLFLECSVSYLELTQLKLKYTQQLRLLLVCYRSSMAGQGWSQQMAWRFLVLNTHNSTQTSAHLELEDPEYGQCWGMFMVE